MENARAIATTSATRVTAVDKVLIDPKADVAVEKIDAEISRLSRKGEAIARALKVAENAQADAQAQLQTLEHEQASAEQQRRIAGLAETAGKASQVIVSKMAELAEAQQNFDSTIWQLRSMGERALADRLTTEHLSRQGIVDRIPA